MTPKPTEAQRKRMEWGPDSIVVEKRSKDHEADKETAATMRADDRPEEAPVTTEALTKGEPNPGTDKDKRLKENKKAKAGAFDVSDIADGPEAIRPRDEGTDTGLGVGLHAGSVHGQRGEYVADWHPSGPPGVAGLGSRAAGRDQQ